MRKAGQLEYLHGRKYQEKKKKNKTYRERKKEVHVSEPIQITNIGAGEGSAIEPAAKHHLPHLVMREATISILKSVQSE
jgi:hypothetical protein